MTTMIAIQTISGGDKFVTEDAAFPLAGLSYRYAPIENAILFPSVFEAVRWIERTAFYNGKAAGWAAHNSYKTNGSYSGSPRLVRVEVETEPRYRVVGLVE